MNEIVVNRGIVAVQFDPILVVLIDRVPINQDAVGVGPIGRVG